MRPIWVIDHKSGNSHLGEITPWILKKFVSAAGVEKRQGCSERAMIEAGNVMGHPWGGMPRSQYVLIGKPRLT